VIQQFNIEYYDNTKGQLINFNTLIKLFYDHIDQQIMQQNSLGSCKHCITIHWLLTHLPYDEIILLDSDVLLKRPIDFIDRQYLSIGSLNQNEVAINQKRSYRILPFIQYFNLALFRSHKCKYFDPSRIIGLGKYHNKIYDTGASFYEDIKNKSNSIKINTTLNIFKYIAHMNSGSWSTHSPNQWLYEHRNLWECNSNKINGKKGIISLTTWPARIEYVGCTIYNLIKYCTGFHIVLCLALDEFPNKFNDLPIDLLNMYKANLFEIIWAEKNLRPHNKYYFTMLKYRNMPIITVDDDQLVNENIAERLYMSYIKQPNLIHAGRCHEIKYDENGKALPYNSWIFNQTQIRNPSDALFATGVGGVLYPPNILQLSASCIPTILDVITADDIYLKVRENELKLKIQWVPGIHFKDIVAPNGLALQNNLGDRLNDTYIKKYL
jgi:hypothetical protein